MRGGTTRSLHGTPSRLALGAAAEWEISFAPRRGGISPGRVSALVQGVAVTLRASGSPSSQRTSSRPLADRVTTTGKREAIMSRPRGCVITHLRDITSSGNSTGGSAGSPFVQKSISVLDSCSWASLSADANALSNITTHHHSVTQTHPIQQTNPWRLEESHSILQSVVSRYFTPPVRSSPVQSGPGGPAQSGHHLQTTERPGNKQEPSIFRPTTCCRPSTIKASIVPLTNQ
jgi:hypothetical protein